MASSQIRVPLALSAILATSLVWPAVADAQYHRTRGPVVRASVYVGWYGSYGWWGAPYWVPYQPYGYYGYPPFSGAAAVRIDVDQREAEVFVDGYAAGVVDEFDGVFQRLNLEPGGHEITIYLQGFRTISERLYLRPGADHRIRLNMEPLAPGEASAPPPAPADRQPRRDDMAPGRATQADAPEREPVQREPVVFYGTLALRVQPGDAAILVDGEPWSVTTDQPRVSLQLPEGRHRIEVRKDGFATFTEEVLIQRNRVLSLNVSLIRRG